MMGLIAIVALGAGVALAVLGADRPRPAEAVARLGGLLIAAGLVLLGIALSRAL